ncbi:NAD(+) synthase [Eubacterium barkeri]|uniref:Glutamine-dependent NAD(+) synthetase n=1 Tax=Eubacterium barkeri TaxID=1528 RepID=A0A1H3AX19_EUBBA|nr:NAD(+) synthase [Eubacterium barkeri]SDX34280.1 NH(3)-dependent NAD(+) synthetase [Eubacterium barkeri]
MKRFGFVKTACAVPQVVVADTVANTDKILELCQQAWNGGVGIVIFPELCLTGYTCGDLFAQSLLMDGVAEGLGRIGAWSQNKDILIILGAPIPVDGAVYNGAVAFNQGELLGMVPKVYVPNSHEFYEKRWFSSGASLKREWASFAGFDFPVGTDLLFRSEDWPELALGIEVCEDLWAPIPPSGKLSVAGAVLIANPSASNELIGKGEYRQELVKQQSARCNAGYLYCSSGTGESTTDLVFGGDALVYEKGTLLAKSTRFAFEDQLVVADVDVEALLHDRRTQSSFMDGVAFYGDAPLRDVFFTIRHGYKVERSFNPSPFVPADAERRRVRCGEIFNIQSMGLVSRLKHIGEPPMVLGISGGLDSTLALLVCVNACDRMGISRDRIHAITMPGFGTTDRTYDNAVSLIKGLGATFHEISIKDACVKHLEAIGHDLRVHDVTYENAQARERTQILMDVANDLGGIVVGTGDLSELALGWATYNGDHMSMYGVNAGIPKTLVRYLVSYVADMNGDGAIQEILYDVLDTPVSPELLPPDETGKIAQKTEDLVGPYALHDFFLYHVMRNGFAPEKIFFMACQAFDGVYGETVIYKWLRNFYWRFFSQQFKRSCLPDGPKVGSVALSPRGDWRMPSDAKVRLWMDEMDRIGECVEK